MTDNIETAGEPAEMMSYTGDWQDPARHEQAHRRRIEDWLSPTFPTRRKKLVISTGA